MAGVGRNDPCPCGSRRKFKACHADDPGAMKAQLLAETATALQQVVALNKLVGDSLRSEWLATHSEFHWRGVVYLLATHPWLTLAEARKTVNFTTRHVFGGEVEGAGAFTAPRASETNDFIGARTVFDGRDVFLGLRDGERIALGSLDDPDPGMPAFKASRASEASYARVERMTHESVIGVLERRYSRTTHAARLEDSPLLHHKRNCPNRALVLFERGRAKMAGRTQEECRAFVVEDILSQVPDELHQRFRDGCGPWLDKIVSAVRDGDFVRTVRTMDDLMSDVLAPDERREVVSDAYAPAQVAKRALSYEGGC